ncbi:hypothetical protein ACQKOE_07435 [Novosphingobium sp. NPDC080210]|uniref:hypothetical protein n=1 Tax=Novosphingobium sp. NPDC080210 TaxID=3390596 RepID=UPI003D01217C
MIRQEDKDEVMAFIDLNGGPKQVSLSDTTHLFHFHRSDWQESPLVLVNKNGNYCRILRNMQGEHFCVDTWNSLFDWQPWMFKMQRLDPDPEKILAMISVGNGNKPECMTLFPREAYPGKGRYACVRWKALPVRFNLDNGTFSIPVDTAQRTFSGKLWENVEAFKAVLACMSATPPNLATGVIENPFERQVAYEQHAVALQDNPLWGAFG